MQPLLRNDLASVSVAIAPPSFVGYGILLATTRILITEIAETYLMLSSNIFINLGSKSLYAAYAASS